MKATDYYRMLDERVIAHTRRAPVQDTVMTDAICEKVGQLWVSYVTEVGWMFLRAVERGGKWTFQQIEVPVDKEEPIAVCKRNALKAAVEIIRTTESHKKEGSR